jgi:ribose-phosphate pyrophosphokinase
VERIQESALRKVTVTDTVPVPQEKRIDKIEILSVAGMFAGAIKAIHDGDSVSALFRDRPR